MLGVEASSWGCKTGHWEFAGKKRDVIGDIMGNNRIMMIYQTYNIGIGHVYPAHIGDFGTQKMSDLTVSWL